MIKMIDRMTNRVLLLFPLLFLISGIVLYIRVYVPSVCYYSKINSPYNFEQYEFNISDSVLISAITQFKEMNSEYNFGKTPDITRNGNSNFYNCYFSVPYRNIAFHCLVKINKENSVPAALKLWRVRDSNSQEWYFINNKNLDRGVNRFHKWMFESEILNKLGEEWKRDKYWWNMFVSQY
jgi:hypothetical protein